MFGYYTQEINKQEGHPVWLYTWTINLEPGHSSPTMAALHSGYHHELLRRWQSSFSAALSTDCFMYPIFVRYVPPSGLESGFISQVSTVGLLHLAYYCLEICTSCLPFLLDI